MGNYTIKGLAKSYGCENLSESGLAEVWDYWLTCNCCDKQSVNSFYSLRKSERRKMLDYLMFSNDFNDLFNHIVKNIK